MSEHKFPHLFEPGQIGSLSLKNRIVKAPQSSGLSNMDGTVSERLINHYQRLAQGGTAMIVVEYAYVDNIASKSAHCQLGISNDEHIPGLAWLAETIKENGAVAAIQIEHCGRQKFLGIPPIKSASSIPWPALMHRVGKAAVPEAMTIDDIRRVVDAFGDAAVRAVAAGFDLIEIHGAHGYLITNFLSPHTNMRGDKYGGSLENRMRLLVEIVENIKSKIGNDFPLTVRLSGTDYEPDGFGIEETIQVARKMEIMGLHAIHVSGGDHHQMIHQVSPMAIPIGHNVWAAEAIKKELKIPVIASGSITTPELAEDIIASGKGDYVGLGRPLWADPDWPKKAEAGHPEDIRPCIRCNEGCLERTFFKFRAVTCGVNPTVGREKDLALTPAQNKKRVVIIGGGPAGMEAARVCGLRGHEVTLFEKRKLGGLLNEAAVPEFKSDIRLFVDYLRHQMEKLNINVVNKQVVVDNLNHGQFDVAIVATGSQPIKPKIEGIDRSTVYDAVDILNNQAQVGRRIAVIGAGMVGTEVALYLAGQGKKVTLVEMLEEIMHDCAVTDKLAYAEMMKKTDITVLTSHILKEIDDKGAIVINQDGVETHIPVDNIVIAVGYKSINGLTDQLRSDTNMEVFEIGDCIKPGKIFDAVHTAYKTSIKI